MIHQLQPSKTSCGPTVVAMIVGAPVEQVVKALPAVRKPARARKRDHGTNVGEIIRLLKHYGFTIGRRLRDPVPVHGLVLLRIQHWANRQTGGWHWAVVYEGSVYDPAKEAVLPLNQYLQLGANLAKRLSWYEVENIAL